MRVLVLGGVSYNMMIHVDEWPSSAATLHARAHHETVGSTGAGKALALHRLGMDVNFYGLIGEDEYGEEIKRYFQRERVSFHYDIDPQGTERHVNIMKESTGERLSVFLTSPPENVSMREEKVERLIAESDVVFLNIAPYCKRFISLIEKHGKETWCDLHSYDGQNPYYAPFIDTADVIQFSSERIEDAAPVLRRLTEQGKKLAIATHGAGGAEAMTRDGQRLNVDALPYEVTDSNGAGDNFLIGILFGSHKGYEWEKAMRIGTICAGLSVTSKELCSDDLSEQKIEAEYRRWYGD